MPKPTKTQLIILLTAAVLCFGAGTIYGRQLQGREQAAAALLIPLSEPEPPPERASEPLPAAVEEKPAAIAVHVKGAVERPGLYDLPEGSRVGDALATAGLLEEANTDIVNLAAPLEDGMEVVVPFRVAGEETDWQALAQSVNSAQVSGSAGVATAVASGPININSAGSAALQTLTGIGPSKAQAIIDYREQQGPFHKIEDIKKVSGIGEATYEKIKGSITVE